MACGSDVNRQAASITAACWLAAPSPKPTVPDHGRSSRNSNRGTSGAREFLALSG